MVSAHPSPQPKRHLDRLSRFCTAHYRVRPTDRKTDRPTDRTRYTWSVTVGRICVCRCAMRPNNDHNNHMHNVTITSCYKYFVLLTVFPNWPAKSVESKTTVLFKDVIVFVVDSSTTPSNVNTTSNIAVSSSVAGL